MSQINVNDVEQLIAACTQRPDYPSLVMQTRQALGTYYTGMALRRLINPYPAEDDDKFTWRRERMLDENDNYVKEVTNLYIEGVFRTKPAERKTGINSLDKYLSEEYDRWCNDELYAFSLIMDECYVVITVPEAKGEVHNLADRNALQGLPFPTIYFPQYCVNLQLNEGGALDWICFYEGDPPEIDENGIPTPTTGKEATEKRLYTLYDDTYCLTLNEKGEVQKQVEHGYGFVPVIRVQYGADHSAKDPIRMGHAFMRSIVNLNMASLNAIGALQDYIYYSLYPKAVMGERTAENVLNDGDGAASIVRHAGDGPGGMKQEINPYYMKVPIEELEALERIVYERIPAKVYRTARLRDRTTNKSLRVTQQSGVSKAFDMVPELGVMKKVAQFWQRIEETIIKMFVQLLDGNPDRVTVQYPQSFDTKSLSEIMAENVQFGQAMKATAMPSSNDGTLELAKRAYRAMVPDMPDAWYEMVYGQLEAALQAPNVGTNEEPELVTTEPSYELPIGEEPEFPQGVGR